MDEAVLNTVWQERKKFWNEANRLDAEHDRLDVRGLSSVGGRKLMARSRKLKAHGDLLFFDAVIQECGNGVSVDWLHGVCILGNGLRFE